ncbi:MAG: DUF3035 domain-containing protein [Acidimicrobiia bacterium]|nr:DUF3035 domain-containing protein [Acidimicrobiia bacterium]
MTAKRIIIATGWVALVLALGACDDTRKILGMDKRPPDEFSVYSRAPLSLPPNFDLRPPAPGEARPQETMPSTEAEQALRGRRPGLIEEQPAPEGSSDGVRALLRQTGGLTVQPNIRVVVNEEAAALAQETERVTDKILFWRKPEPEGVVVNAEKENQRIRDNQALGKPVNEGETPVIQRKKRGLF